MSRAANTRIVGRIERAPSGGGYTVTVVREVELSRTWCAGTPSKHAAVVDKLAELMNAIGIDPSLVARSAGEELRATHGLRAEVAAIAPRRRRKRGG